MAFFQWTKKKKTYTQHSCLKFIKFNSIWTKIWYGPARRPIYAVYKLGKCLLDFFFSKIAAKSNNHQSNLMRTRLPRAQNAHAHKRTSARFSQPNNYENYRCKRLIGTIFNFQHSSPFQTNTTARTCTHTANKERMKEHQFWMKHSKQRKRFCVISMLCRVVFGKHVKNTNILCMLLAMIRWLWINFYLIQQFSLERREKNNNRRTLDVRIMMMDAHLSRWCAIHILIASILWCTQPYRVMFEMCVCVFFSTILNLV